MKKGANEIMQALKSELAAKNLLDEVEILMYLALALVTWALN
jgi:hypothetical protein